MHTERLELCEDFGSCISLKTAEDTPFLSSVGNKKLKLIYSLQVMLTNAMVNDIYKEEFDDIFFVDYCIALSDLIAIVEQRVGRYVAPKQDFYGALEFIRNYQFMVTAAYGEEVLPLIRQKGEKYYPDLKAINALALRRAGVRHIEISEACTWCESDRFWSHRVTKGDRGSQGAVITCKEGKA